MSTPPQRLIGVVVFAFAIALLAWTLLRSSEPAYDGKPLSAWAQQYGSNHWAGAVGRAAAEEAEYAIRQIGTNSIPLLLDRIRVRDSALRKKLRNIVPRRWHDALHLRDMSGEIHRVGAHGLAALGTNASPALPALLDIAANHPDEDSRYIAVFALRTLGSAAESALPFLIGCLTNEVRIIRDEAALSLGAMRRRPDIVVPALLRYVDSVKTSGGWEVTDAIAALAQFGTNAKPAVPTLIVLLDHPDPSVRAEVTNWLPRIDAEAATEAGLMRPGL